MPIQYLNLLKITTSFNPSSPEYKDFTEKMLTSNVAKSIELTCHFRSSNLFKSIDVTVSPPESVTIKSIYLDNDGNE